MIFLFAFGISQESSGCDGISWNRTEDKCVGGPAASWKISVCRIQLFLWERKLRREDRYFKWFNLLTLYEDKFTEFNKLLKVRLSS